MNSQNDNIDTASGIAQDKKVHVQALSRGVHLKSKLHSTTQANHNWKPISAFAMHLGGKWGQHTVSILKLVPSRYMLIV